MGPDKGEQDVAAEGWSQEFTSSHSLGDELGDKQFGYDDKTDGVDARNAYNAFRPPNSERDRRGSRIVSNRVRRDNINTNLIRSDRTSEH